MPNQPKTIARSIRIDGPLWDDAAAAAAYNGTNISVEVRKFLQRYVKTTTKQRQEQDQLAGSDTRS